VELHVSLFGGVNDTDAMGPYQRRTGIPDADGLGVNLDEDADFYGTCPGCDPFGYADTDGDPHALDIDRIGFLERESWGITGRLTWDFTPFTLTAITHYMDFQFDYLEDQDVSPVAFTEFAFGQDADQFSQEIRLDGELESLRWVAGFYYLSIESANRQTFHLLPPFGGVMLDTAWAVDTESWAVFGQFEYDLAAQWTFIGGLRWTDDRKEIDLLNTISLAGVGSFEIPFNEAVNGALARQKDGDYSFKAELDYRPVEDWLLYASITRGNKGGSFSAPLDMSVTPPSSLRYGPETLLSYELGLKSEFLDGRAHLNAAAFYYDYDDYQAFRLENLVQMVFNAQAEIYGAEVEFFLEPAQGWTLMLGASLLDANVEDVTLPSGRVTDREPPQAPSFTLNGLLRKEWQAFGGTLALQGDFRYVDDYQASVLNSPATRIPASVIGNARLAYEPAGERWEVAVFVKNIADAEAETYAFDLVTSGLPFNQVIYMPPRWVGGQVVYRW
jgi:iron complex outermembrane receptor protein